MARNVEFKARVHDLEGIRSKATALADGPEVILHQVDTFFVARQGRVKLRRVWSTEGSGLTEGFGSTEGSGLAEGSGSSGHYGSGGWSGLSGGPASMLGEPGSVELILYRREDKAGARLSRYQRLVPVATAAVDGAASDECAAELTVSLLSEAIGVRGEVSKTRTLLLIGQTRVHLDKVEGLGEFVELEVVLKPDQSEASGRKVAESLMFALGIDPDWIEPRAYIDLLELTRL